MPSCSVVVCKNTSSKVNYVEDRISFHVYPKDPKIQEKWIDATGRGPNWFPTKHSTICSVHFEPRCMQPLKNVRRLFEWSVPTLKLYTKLMNYNNMEPSTSKMSVDSQLDIETDLKYTCEQSNILEHAEDPDKNLINETPRMRKLRRIISTQASYIKKQKSQIKSLQKNTSRYRKKIANLKTILDTLKRKNYIGGDHVVTQLENSGVKDLMDRYEENV